MKNKNRLVYFLLVAAVGLQCTTATIVLKGKPRITDYKKYPYRTIKKSSAIPFTFPVSTKINGLDTLVINSTEPMYFGTQTRLKAFLEATNTKIFIVISHDSIVYEYKATQYKETWINTFSVSKSMISLLTGIALSEGKIKSLSDEVVVYLPQLKKNPAFSGITLQHLLMMTSGLKFSKISSSVFKTIKSDEAKTYFTKDLHQFIAQSRREYEPGKYWVYKNTDVELLAWVLQAATGKKIADYFEEKIWSRIGAETDAAWTIDKKGNERTHCCFYARAIDLAKIGQLLLNNGKWKGEQLIPAEWIEKLVAIDNTQVSAPPEKKDVKIMQHQYLWWKPTHPAAQDFQANGVNGQCLYVDPATKTVIVKLSDKNSIGYPYRKIVSYLNNLPYKPELPKYKMY